MKGEKSGGTNPDGEEEGDEEGADEAFDGFLRRELDELVATEGHSCVPHNTSVPPIPAPPLSRQRRRRERTTNISRNVVDDDQTRRDPEPNHSLEDVVDDEVGRDDDEEEGHVDPPEEAELTTEGVAVQGGDEGDEACSTER
jgi:hypothetical protein